MNCLVSLIAALSLLCSCASHKPFPKTNSGEIKWEQEYRDGKLSWSEYQSLLKGEAAVYATPTPHPSPPK